MVTGVYFARMLISHQSGGRGRSLMLQRHPTCSSSSSPENPAREKGMISSGDRCRHPLRSLVHNLSL